MAIEEWLSKKEMNHQIVEEDQYGMDQMGDDEDSTRFLGLIEGLLADDSEEELQQEERMKTRVAPEFPEVVPASSSMAKVQNAVQHVGNSQMADLDQLLAQIKAVRARSEALQADQDMTSMRLISIGQHFQQLGAVLTGAASEAMMLQAAAGTGGTDWSNQSPMAMAWSAMQAALTANQQQKDAEDLKKPTSGHPGEAPKKPSTGHTFTFTLRKATGIDLGLDVSHDKGDQSLRVEAVRAHGAIEAWNKLCGDESNSRCVDPGDLITSVNGFTNDPERMLMECRDKPLLKLTVIKQSGESQNELEEKVAAPRAQAPAGFMVSSPIW